MKLETMALTNSIDPERFSVYSSTKSLLSSPNVDVWCALVKSTLKCIVDNASAAL